MTTTVYEAEVIVVKNTFEPRTIRRAEVDTKAEAEAYIADLKEKLGEAVLGTRITRHVTESHVEHETGCLDRSDKIVIINEPAVDIKPEPTNVLSVSSSPIENLASIPDVGIGELDVTTEA